MNNKAPRRSSNDKIRHWVLGASQEVQIFPEMQGGVAGERLENGSLEGSLVRLGVGREVELDNWKWGRRLGNGNSSNMAIEEAGSHQALGFTASTGVLGCVDLADVSLERKLAV